MENLSETRRLSAILFSDIHGYSRMMQNDEVGTLALLDDHNHLFFPIIEKNNGRIIKTIGDSIMAVFDSCTNAFQSAIEMQEALVNRSANNTNSPTFRIRIGIHLGEIVFKGNDVFGNGVNIAARLQPMADPGGICISLALYDQIPSLHDKNFIKVGPVNLKNINEPVVIYRLQIDTNIESSSLLTGEKGIALTEYNPIQKIESIDLISNDKIQEVYSVLGGVTKKGNWIKSKWIRITNIFSGLKLDLTNMNLGPGVFEIRVFSLFGAIDVILPPYYNLDLDCYAILGAVESNASIDLESATTIRISGKVFLGAVEINN